MMIIRFTDRFRRQYKKTDVRIQKQLKQCLAIFTKNPNDLQLNNHPLKREYEGHRSIDITSDWRAIYREAGKVEGEVVIYFTSLGTHSQLYG